MLDPDGWMIPLDQREPRAVLAAPRVQRPLRRPLCLRTVPFADLSALPPHFTPPRTSHPTTTTRHTHHHPRAFLTHCRAQACSVWQQGQGAGSRAAAGPRQAARRARAADQPHAAGGDCGRPRRGEPAGGRCSVLSTRCADHASSRTPSAAASSAPVPSPRRPLCDHPPAPALPPAPLQIWDPSNQGQVLQVEPFRPWEEQAALECGLTDTPTTQTLSAQVGPSAAGHRRGGGRARDGGRLGAGPAAAGCSARGSGW